MAVRANCPEELFLRAVFADELSDERDLVPFSRGADSRLSELRCRITEALDLLSYRDRGVVEMRFGLRDGWAYTLAEAGFVFKLTRERIRQIQVKALRKIREQADGLMSFAAAVRHSAKG